jgi:hypothetical protein
MIKFCSLLTLLLIVTTSYSQQATGKIKLEQGQVFEISLETKTKISQEAMGQAIDFDMTGNAVHNYKVTNAGSDNTTLHHDVKRISFLFEGMGQKRSVDSDKPKDLEGQAGKPIKDILSKTFDVIVDTSGKALMVQPEKVEGASFDDRYKLLVTMLKDVMDVVQPPQKGSASFFKILPDNGAGKGDSWTESSTAEDNKFSRKYTLTDITDSTLVVDFTGTSNTVTKAEMMGMETTTTMNDKTTGQIILDKATGIIRQKTITTESTGTTEAMGGNLPVSSKTTITVKVRPIMQ